MSFRDQVVWITGASSGIGEALAYALSERRARLIVSARREQKLLEVQAACADPHAHLVLPLDLTDPEAIEPVTTAALKHGNRIDILIHNAGLSQRSLAKDTSLEVVRRILETNFFGTVALTVALLPAMLERRVGRFVVVTSLVGKFGTPLRSAYAASKHALHGFFDSLRAEVWGAGLRVTLVCPGFIRTDLPLHALTGDGSPQAKMDRAQEEGYPAERCAREILRAIERDREEVLIGGKEKYAVYLKRFLPGVFSRVIRRVRVT
ncbi:MAG: SDR family oxidoreductase [Thermoanaerobaculia bacterium]